MNKNKTIQQAQSEERNDLFLKWKTISVIASDQQQPFIFQKTNIHLEQVATWEQPGH